MTATAIASRLARRLSWEELDPSCLDQLIEIARREDLDGYGLAASPANSGDLSSALLASGQSSGSARLVAREELVLAGLPLVERILKHYGDRSTVRLLAKDGDCVKAGSVIAELSGPSATLLQAERVLLNFLQHLSGIATLTREYVRALGESGTRLLDTRKTHPGYRVLEKYAVARGGGYNHRLGLFDRIMIKDNHLAAAKATEGGALRRFLESAKAASPGRTVQLEVDSLDQIPPALEAGIEWLLLDNFSMEALRDAVALVGHQAATEASGGVTLGSLPSLASLGLDFISTGATVHQARWVDLGLDWE